MRPLWTLRIRTCATINQRTRARLTRKAQRQFTHTGEIRRPIRSEGDRQPGVEFPARGALERAVEDEIELRPAVVDDRRQVAVVDAVEQVGVVQGGAVPELCLQAAGPGADAVGVAVEVEAGGKAVVSTDGFFEDASDWGLGKDWIVGGGGGE